MHTTNSSSLFVVFCAVLAAACGGGLSTDEAEGVSSGSDTTLAQQHALSLSDELFAFDPTLDPTRTVPENVAAITQRAQSTLSPCATVTFTATSVTVTAPSSGCTAGGVTWSGTLTATVTKSGNTLTVSLSWSNVVLNGSTFTGMMSFATSNGSTFSVTFAVTRDGKSVTGTLTVTGAPGQITSSGTLTNGATSAVFSNVVWKKGECYPDAGTLAVTVGRITTTYTFTSSTPTTGTVTTARGQTAQLPAYGSCPPSSDAGK